jgi:hypothetical protein
MAVGALDFTSVHGGGWEVGVNSSHDSWGKNEMDLNSWILYPSTVIDPLNLLMA